MNGSFETRDRIVSAAVARNTGDPTKCGVVKFLRVSFDAPDVEGTSPDTKVALLNKYYYFKIYKTVYTTVDILFHDTDLKGYVY